MKAGNEPQSARPNRKAPGALETNHRGTAAGRRRLIRAGADDAPRLYAASAVAGEAALRALDIGKHASTSWCLNPLQLGLR